MHWQDSRADKALRSRVAVDGHNWGLEMGGGPFITANMADLVLSEADLDGIEASLNVELDSTWSRMTRSVLVWAVVPALTFLASLLGALPAVGLPGWALGVLTGVTVAAVAMVVLLHSNLPRVRYMALLKAQLAPAGQDLEHYAWMLSAEVSRPREAQCQWLRQQLEHVLRRGTPVRRLEDDNLRAMAHLSRMPSLGCFDF